VLGCDQRIKVPLDGFGDGAGQHDPDLDIAPLSGLGEVCGADERFCAVNGDALCVQAGVRCLAEARLRGS
jgi:hypothetical protein